MLTESDWAELEAQQTTGTGLLQRRLKSAHHDIFVGVSRPWNRRAFWLDTPLDALTGVTLPRLRSISTMTGTDDGGGRGRIFIELESADLKDVFRALINDIVAAIEGSKEPEGAVRALVRRLERWQRLLKGETGGGLTREEQRGLYGELILLTQLLDLGEDPGQAISSWTGPYGRHQDFQANQVAIEVKTTATKQPQSIVITSERELDDTGVDRLFLVHVSLDERQGGSGESLPQAVSRVSTLLADAPVALERFEDALVHVGYLEAHQGLYADTVYEVRRTGAFQVRDGFPRIVEDLLAVGVGDVRYSVQIAALEPFRVDLNDALVGIGAVS